MIRLSFGGSDQRVTVAIRARGPRIIAEERAEMQEAMLDLQREVQRNLSGAVLKNRRTPGLLGTVRVPPVEATEDQVVGTVQAGGGLFWWARVHEMGGEKAFDIFPGIVTGKSDKKALAFFPGGSEGAGFGTTATTRIIARLGKRRGEIRPNRIGEFHAAGGVVVKSVHHPPLPRRSFMASALNARREEIIRRLYAGAARAVR